MEARKNLGAEVLSESWTLASSSGASGLPKSLREPWQPVRNASIALKFEARQCARARLATGATTEAEVWAEVLNIRTLNVEIFVARTPSREEGGLG